ncbi:MAG TPA: hypothetical protein VLT57_20225, partial [Bryobacteraceae bacterium]|nr:hypothetical protein [Bryobacteraceae bacterium]
KAGVFKTHPRRGDVLNAIHLRTRYIRETNTYVFATDITIYILLGDEYVSWMVLPAGSSPSEYPELFKS